MKIILNGKYFVDKENSYDYLIGRLHLPSYTGHNLDALWDVFWDLPAMEIELIHARLLLDNLGDYGRNFLDLFGDLDQETDHQITLKW